MRKLLFSLAVLAGAVALNSGAQAAPAVSAVSAVSTIERPATVQTAAYHRYYHRRYYRRHYRR